MRAYMNGQLQVQKSYRIVGNFRGIHDKSSEASRIKLRGFKFRDNQHAAGPKFGAVWVADYARRYSTNV